MMKRNFFCTFIIAGLCSTALYAGFLEPAVFPKVTADLSFVDRMALNSAGYEPYESEYDENGKCVSGCSYVQMNLEDELSFLNINDFNKNRPLNYNKIQDNSLWSNDHIYTIDDN